MQIVGTIANHLDNFVKYLENVLTGCIGWKRQIEQIFHTGIYDS